MKNPDDPIGNRTRDLPACNSVPLSVGMPGYYRLCVTDTEPGTVMTVLVPHRPVLNDDR